MEEQDLFIVDIKFCEDGASEAPSQKVYYVFARTPIKALEKAERFGHINKKIESVQIKKIDDQIIF